MSWKEKLTSDGYRITSPRKWVHQILSETVVPLSPLQIHEEAKNRQVDLGMVSVYRALELFLENGLVRKVLLPGDCHGYTLASPGHTHALVCRLCQRSIEFEGEENLEEFIRLVEKNTGFLIEDHLLQLDGICPDCRKTH